MEEIKDTLLLRRVLRLLSCPKLSLRSKQWLATNLSDSLFNIGKEPDFQFAEEGTGDDLADRISDALSIFGNKAAIFQIFKRKFILGECQVSQKVIGRLFSDDNDTVIEFLHELEQLLLEMISGEIAPEGDPPPAMIT